MEKEIIKEICKDLNWKERILVRTFKRIFVKVYHKTRIRTFNITVR